MLNNIFSVIMCAPLAISKEHTHTVHYTNTHTQGRGRDRERDSNGKTTHTHTHTPHTHVLFYLNYMRSHTFLLSTHIYDAVCFST